MYDIVWPLDFDLANKEKYCVYVCSMYIIINKFFPSLSLSLSFPPSPSPSLSLSLPLSGMARLDLLSVSTPSTLRTTTLATCSEATTCVETQIAVHS